MADRITCLPLLATTDGPLFSTKPGTLSALTNMTLQPGGFAEARGGLTPLKPTAAGTPANFISAGGHSCVHELSSTFGWIRTFDKAAATNSQYSGNLALYPGGFRPFPTVIVDDWIGWFSDSPFSRVGVRVAHAGVWVSATFVYEYTNGITWATVPTMSETITWSGNGYQYASWALPTDFAPIPVGDTGTGSIYKYGVRCRITAINTVSTVPLLFSAFAFWSGSRDIFVAGQNPAASAITGTLKRYGQSGATTGEAFSISTALFSGVTCPTRIVSYRGRIFLVNGMDGKRYDGANLSDIGLPEGTWVGNGSISSNLPLPTGDPFFHAVTPTAGALPAGTYRWYVAWGYGPPTAPEYNRYATPAVSGDVAPMYGYGRSHYIGELTLAAASTVTLNFHATNTVVPADAGAWALYRTQDLTTMDQDKRSTAPAFMLWSYARSGPATSLSNAFGTLTPVDDGGGTLYPPIEMFNYDIAPPLMAKFAVVHQNRLLLGTDDTWYWSDPFVPDRFRKYVSFISLAKSTGGRHMGGAEYADQAVLFTEDQTWGLTNIDLDIPNLYPIHPGIGCIAPDSIATGDGLIIWAARDGIYAWDGGPKGPRKVSWDWNETFGKMAYETHGGSRAIIHNYNYDIRLASPDHTTTQGLFRLNLLTMQWSTIVFYVTEDDTLYPFGPVHAPLGTTDAGGFHPVYAHGAYSGASAFRVYLGEQTTQDNENNFYCSADMHFGLPPGGTFKPQRILAYYTAADGWQTPAITFPPGTSIIGDPLGTITTGSPDTGSDYSVVGGTPAEAGTGTSDLRFRFTVSTELGLGVGKQRLYGAVLEGTRGRIRVGSV